MNILTLHTAIQRILFSMASILEKWMVQDSILFNMYLLVSTKYILSHTKQVIKDGLMMKRATMPAFLLRSADIYTARPQKLWQKQQRSIRFV